MHTDSDCDRESTDIHSDEHSEMCNGSDDHE